mgnify:CR=1 FL=1
MPLHAIRNKNYVGGAPKCLTDFTEIELALLSPVHAHGYCFSYVGGKQKNLKETLTFMRVEERILARAVTQLRTMGLTKYIVILSTGNMTDQQKQKV